MAREPGARQQFPHFLVARLREVGVPEADGEAARSRGSQIKEPTNGAPFVDGGRSGRSTRQRDAICTLHFAEPTTPSFSLETSYFAIYAIDRPGLAATREEARERHRLYIRAPNPQGVETLLGGPLLDERGQMNGTLLVVRAASIDDVRQFVAADPYSLAGLFERVEIRAWRWGLGQPAAEEVPGPSA